MDKEIVKAAILDVFEASLDAQLRAIRRLRTEPAAPKAGRQKGMSQVDLAHDILRGVGHPLHVTEIIERVEQAHGRRLDRESLVSALVKKVQRSDRFVRTDRNVFGLKEEG